MSAAATGPSTQVRDEPAAYEVTGSREVFSGRVITVVKDDVVMTDGTVIDRDVVLHPGAVGVIALDHRERVLLVQQYRHPVRRKLWEPPAGLLDVPGEAPLAAAQRELYEEGHQRAATWDVLVDTFTSPGMADEALRIYLARDLTTVAEVERFVGEHEEIDMPVTWLPLSDAVDLVLAGRLHNPTCVKGVLAAWVARERGWTGLRPADTPWPERPAGGGSKA